ncbi:DUF3035 domain-containing protein [Oceanicella actignis]|uniref:DUF3035 domain-containing protein n=1 Tax=Oceanicella actignis TaxID=1189325 RepID=UPI0011E6D2AD|nr:DUF3035 domain-containing protein [Oceanicella actignis]TYO88159.1 Protein of unknown function (DUF3035) [Oceanicella actignis]
MSELRSARLRRPLRLCLVAAVAALAAGCGGRTDLGEALGIKLSSPDAFNVYPRKPLRLPPDLNALPEPRPGAPSPLDPDPLAEARAALGGVGATPDPAAAPSTGELTLLDRAGANEAPADIRRQLEAPERNRRSPYGLSSLFGIPVPDYEVGGDSPVLDPRAEAERLLELGAPTPSAPPPAPEQPSNEWILGEIL